MFWWPWRLNNDCPPPKSISISSICIKAASLHKKLIFGISRYTRKSRQEFHFRNLDPFFGNSWFWCGFLDCDFLRKFKKMRWWCITVYGSGLALKIACGFLTRCLGVQMTQRASAEWWRRRKPTVLYWLTADCPSKRDKKIGIYNGNVGPTPVEIDAWRTPKEIDFLKARQAYLAKCVVFVSTFLAHLRYLIRGVRGCTELWIIRNFTTSLLYVTICNWAGRCLLLPCVLQVIESENKKDLH